VAPEAGSAVASLYDALREGGEQILAEARATVAKAGVAVEVVQLDTLSGRVSDLVIDHARTWRADLIVIGTHGRRGVGRLLLGSDAEQILRSAPVPVLLVRASERPRDAT
jgi:nucleotide-binding universal stress UspA family protein